MWIILVKSFYFLMIFHIYCLRFTGFIGAVEQAWQRPRPNSPMNSCVMNMSDKRRLQLPLLLSNLRWIKTICQGISPRWERVFLTILTNSVPSVSLHVTFTLFFCLLFTNTFILVFLASVEVDAFLGVSNSYNKHLEKSKIIFSSVQCKLLVSFFESKISYNIGIYKIGDVLYCLY